MGDNALKSLNCNSEHDRSRRDTAKDPLLIALNVELQQTTEDKKPDDTWDITAVRKPLWARYCKVLTVTRDKERRGCRKPSLKVTEAWQNNEVVEVRTARPYITEFICSSFDCGESFFGKKRILKRHRPSSRSCQVEADKLETESRSLSFAD